MTPAELERLIAQGEGTTLDFKRNLSEDSFREFSKDLAAFSNADGGLILVGVDNNKDILGVDWSPEKSARVQQEGAKCNPKIQPNLSSVPVPRKGTVVVIDIPRSSSVHQDASQRYPLRVGETTVLMDTALILAVARNKGLIVGEPVIQPSRLEPRRRPTRIAFLADYLSNDNSFVRAEAVMDIGSVALNYSVERISGLLDKMYGLLSDVDPTVRLYTLDAISRMLYRVTPRGRRRLASKFTPKVGELIVSDADTGVRKRALALIVELGSHESVDIILKLILTEPATSFSQLNLFGNWMRLVETGQGHELRKRLYEALSRSQSEETRARLRQVMAELRNVYWAK